MAWDVSIVKKTVFGDTRVSVLSCVADAATQNVETGLSVVNWFEISAQSISTAGANPAIYANSLSAGTASAGYLGCSGFTSGDVFFVTCYGR